jgi:hypothetical protein
VSREQHLRRRRLIVKLLKLVGVKADNVGLRKSRRFALGVHSHELPTEAGVNEFAGYSFLYITAAQKDEV